MSRPAPPRHDTPSLPPPLRAMPHLINPRSVPPPLPPCFAPAPHRTAPHRRRTTLPPHRRRAQTRPSSSRPERGACPCALEACRAEGARTQVCVWYGSGVLCADLDWRVWGEVGWSTDVTAGAWSRQRSASLRCRRMRAAHRCRVTSRSVTSCGWAEGAALERCGAVQFGARGMGRGGHRAGLRLTGRAVV